MKLLRFFKKSKTVKNNVFVPILWEAEYCQIELLPEANTKFIKEQLIALPDFSEKHLIESFDNTFVYDNSTKSDSKSFPTINEEFRADALELMLVNLKLPKFQSIEYGDDESVVVENSRAFGFENFILFFDTKDEFVNNIWVNVPFGTGSANYDAILNVLYDLGESYDLIMMDWNSDTLVDLKNRTDIRKYLNKSLNIKLP